jgi:alpha-N-arabinofuranosidase
VNRSQEGPLALEGDMRGTDGFIVVDHIVLEHEDSLARNTPDRPREVVPHAGGDAAIADGRLSATLPRLSWNVIRLAMEQR